MDAKFDAEAAISDYVRRLWSNFGDVGLVAPYKLGLLTYLLTIVALSVTICEKFVIKM